MWTGGRRAGRTQLIRELTTMEIQTLVSSYCLYLKNVAERIDMSIYCHFSILSQNIIALFLYFFRTASLFRRMAHSAKVSAAKKIAPGPGLGLGGESV